MEKPLAQDLNNLRNYNNAHRQDTPHLVNITLHDLNHTVR